jgi:hypothetical protein
MIQITQAQLNTVVATCSRNKQLTGNVYYLWTMTHKLTKQNWKFIPYLLPATGAIGYEPSYDQFQIDVDSSSAQVYIATGTTTPVNLHLIPGQYYVKIYEQASPTNLNPLTAFDVVYEGMANIIGTNPVYNDIVSYTGNSSSQVFKVYQG